MKNSCDIYDPELQVDGILSLLALNEDFMKEMEKIAPFGNKFPTPTFLLPNCSIQNIKFFSNHMSFQIFSVTSSISSILFNVSKSPLNEIRNGGRFHILGYPVLRNKKLSWIIIDAISSNEMDIIL